MLNWVLVTEAFSSGVRNLGYMYS